jgi:hypothetical protein
MTGTASAVSFSQYWKDCTKVMLRMPPVATLKTTTAATSNPPTQTGAPVASRTVRPAPTSCGSKYSQPIVTTRMLAMRRTWRDSSRASAKSGSV